ncbi:aconitate hydratase [Metasolibacillus sp.]|uniref:aconitate hydratase n=1 Tax=Metasolibacillus sp. TaxID=2703680 RepID=UPI0025ECFFD9|nr:aconitate hydratase [Metasolibacillus sp.]MCT6922834.1 aconitate hydratase [Metasolibacillus sp.]MCT6938827.1 aconitate hydratase [Metasolibacillus sp.]
MINFEQRDLLHNYLLLDLAIKSLQHDQKYLEQCKMKSVLLPTLNILLKDLRKKYFQFKHQLKFHKIKVIAWYPIDEYFIDVKVATVGNDLILHYAKQGLKAQVEQLIINHMKNISLTGT